MPSKRHYCDGHEYRYNEGNTGNTGVVRNNYGALLVLVDRSPCGEYFNVHGADENGEVIPSEFQRVHENEPSVSTFAARAETFIGLAAAWEEYRIDTE